MGIKKFFLWLQLAVTSVVTFVSCSDEPEPQKDRVILIYAVAANSLESYLKDDLNEILRVAPNLNLVNNAVLVYSVDYSNECTLRKLRYNKTSGKYEFVLEKQFDELPLSTSPDKISEVLKYVDTHYDYANKGLILWSHGTGWLPWEGPSTPSDERRRSFGEDKYEGKTYKTNIIELADAIPEDVFDFIWFDCCYMANIETVYQLRNKTRRIGGYVEEIAAYGMPYHLTMPYLLRREADLEGAAREIYEYYDYMQLSAPVSVISTAGLERLAQVSRRIFSTGTPPASLKGIQNYTRSWLTVDGVYFYDMKQLLENYTEVALEIPEDLTDAFKGAVVCKFLANFAYPGPAINIDHYSGLSMHHYVNEDTFDSEYYRKLDWFKATR